MQFPRNSCFLPCNFLSSSRLRLPPKPQRRIPATMEYDFRKPSGSSYDHNVPSYSRPSPTATSSSGAGHSFYGQQPSMYPKIGGAGSHSAAISRNPPFHHAPAPPSNSVMGIRVVIKPEYHITPPPPFFSQPGEIPRSNFQFDFEFEKEVLAEAAKEKPNWSRLVIENVPQREAEPSYGHATDPISSKYIASGLSREAVPFAVANYGDDPTKVKEFAKGYTLLREMGFSSNNVAEALISYDNDADKALAHLLSGTS